MQHLKLHWETNRIMANKILFTICGRAGSKGVKGKNVKTFCGKPIVDYTLEIYKKYKKKYKEQEIYLAINTDSQLLKKQIQDYETDCFFIERKEALAGDVVSKTDVIADTLIQTEQIVGNQMDIIIDLDITSPLRNLADVEGALRLVTEEKECNYAYSVTESRRSPYFNMVCENKDGYYDRVIKSTYTARQQLPVCYDMNASIYVFERDYLLDAKSENRKAHIWIMEDTGILDIDSENDFKLMEVLTEYFWRKGKYQDIKI